MSNPSRTVSRSVAGPLGPGHAMILVCLAMTALAALAAPAPPMGLVVDVPVAAAAVTMDGRRWLVVELHIRNSSPDPMTLREVRITDDREAVARFEGQTLVRMLDHPAGVSGTAIGAGASRVLYVDTALTNAARATALQYQVVASADGVEGIATGGPIALDRRAPVVLGPPLEDGPWVAVHHPDWERGHRRVFYTVDDVTRLPGRFTIDFVGLDADGRTTTGDPDVVSDARGYGATVLAVADARVAAARDDLAEPSRISARVKHPPADAAGNYVALDLGGGRFAVYEHLKPGSVGVRAGQRVRRGDHIAALGFTGDSTGPHLHLHVGDHASPLAAEGLPYVFDRFTVLGRYDDIAALGRAPWTRDGDGVRTRERPAPNVVVDFGAGRR